MLKQESIMEIFEYQTIVNITNNVFRHIKSYKDCISLTEELMDSSYDINPSTFQDEIVLNNNKIKLPYRLNFELYMNDLVNILPKDFYSKLNKKLFKYDSVEFQFTLNGYVVYDMNDCTICTSTVYNNVSIELPEIDLYSIKINNMTDLELVDIVDNIL